jgi:hypothetical protein
LNISKFKLSKAKISIKVKTKLLAIFNNSKPGLNNESDSIKYRINT